MQCSFGGNFSVMIIQHSSLCLLISFVLKSIFLCWNTYRSFFLSSFCLEYLFPYFYPELMSIFLLSFVSCMQGKDRTFLCIYSVSLYLFIVELRPLILRVTNEQYLLIPVIFFGFGCCGSSGGIVLCVCVWCVHVHVLTSLCCSFPSNASVGLY